jgi:hypothetical protein
LKKVQAKKKRDNAIRQEAEDARKLAEEHTAVDTALETEPVGEERSTDLLRSKDEDVIF